MRFQPGQQAYSQSVATSTTQNLTIQDRDPTVNDVIYPIGRFWINTSGERLWFLNSQSSSDATLQSMWVQVAQDISAIETVTGNSGGAVGPDIDNNLNLLGSGNVTVTGDPGTNTLTISFSQEFSWVDVTSATQTLAINTGYITDRSGGVEYLLPSTATEGNIIRIAGKLGSWSISQNALQQINLGSASSTVGTGGSLSSTNVGDCIELLCTTGGSETIWRVLSSIGNITVT